MQDIFRMLSFFPRKADAERPFPPGNASAGIDRLSIAGIAGRKCDSPERTAAKHDGFPQRRTKRPFEERSFSSPSRLPLLFPNLFAAAFSACADASRKMPCGHAGKHARKLCGKMQQPIPEQQGGQDRQGNGLEPARKEVIKRKHQKSDQSRGKQGMMPESIRQPEA